LGKSLELMESDGYPFVEQNRSGIFIRTAWKVSR
jgi:hypothetical protein